MKIEAIACFHIIDSDGQCIGLDRRLPDLAPNAEAEWLLSEVDVLAAKLPDVWTVERSWIELRRVGESS